MRCAALLQAWRQVVLMPDAFWLRYRALSLFTLQPIFSRSGEALLECFCSQTLTHVVFYGHPLGPTISAGCHMLAATAAGAAPSPGEGEASRGKRKRAFEASTNWPRRGL